MFLDGSLADDRSSRGIRFLACSAIDDALVGRVVRNFRESTTAVNATQAAGLILREDSAVAFSHDEKGIAFFLFPNIVCPELERT